MEMDIKLEVAEPEANHYEVEIRTGNGTLLGSVIVFVGSPGSAVIDVLSGSGSYLSTQRVVSPVKIDWKGWRE